MAPCDVAAVWAEAAAALRLRRAELLAKTQQLGLMRRRVQLRLHRRPHPCRARSSLSLRALRQSMRRLPMGCAAARWHPAWQRPAWLGPEVAFDKAP